MLKINLHYKNSTKVDISKNIMRKVKFPILFLKVAKVGDSRRFLLSIMTKGVPYIIIQYFEESA